MNQENSIDALNTIIEINNDRIEGYKTAAEEAEESDLKTLFSQLSRTSQTCNAALIAEVRKLGGTPIEGTKTTGKIYRAWMDFKALLTGKSRSTILNSCEYGEEVALETYEDVLIKHSEDLSTEHQVMLNGQAALIKADQAKIKSMLEMVEA
jgi:uncharacterized protein (TIGR02284 family)